MPVPSLSPERAPAVRARLTGKELDLTEGREQVTPHVTPHVTPQVTLQDTPQVEIADDLRSALAQIEDVLGDLEQRVDAGASEGS